MISTKVFTNAPIEDGIVKGDIYLKGFGDPTLTEPDIKELVSAIAKRGITAIEGNVYADATFFDDITQRHIYSGDNEIVEALAPITALGMNRNGFAVEVQAGEVSIIPHSDAVIVSRSGLSAKEAPVPIIKPSKSKQIASKNRAKRHFPLQKIFRKEDCKQEGHPCKSKEKGKKKPPLTRIFKK